MCTCCIWKLRALTSLRAMVVGVRRAGGRKGSVVNAPDGSPAEGSEGAHLCPPLVKRLQGSQMPDCEPLPVDTYPKCQSRRAPQTHFTLWQGRGENRGSKRSKNCFFMYIFFPFPPLALSVSISASNEELPWTWSAGHQSKKTPLSHSAPAAAALLPVSASSHCIGIYSVPICAKPWRLYDVDLFLEQNWTSTKATFPSSFHFFALPFLRSSLLSFRLIYGYFMISCP